ncbi:GntR family transcriptional regulator [Streptomyces scabiei]|uniref:GntR family transcriptional regulator n=1 Tax=Streptomyces scabiei TaxID=1930 RepID=UPI0038F78A45
MTALVRTALYRLYDSHGVLLYIGATNNPVARWSKHAADKPWWGDVSRQEIEWHGDRPAALKAEKSAIREEQPKYNSEHTAPGAPDVEDTDWGYRAIADDLTARIDRGEFLPGQPIPTVADLMVGYRVARQTVRSAVAVLVRNGSVETRGRRGTFVLGGVGRTVAVPVTDPDQTAKILLQSMRPDQILALVARLSESI